MTERVSRETVVDVLDDYSDPQRDAVLNSLDAERNYVVEDGRVDPRVLPDYGGPDSIFYRNVSREDLEVFDQALSTLKAGIREEDVEGDPLVLNEEAIYDQIASGSIEFYAPWNVGMDQNRSEINRSARHLQEFTEILTDNTFIDVGVTIYTLDAYARNNGNRFQSTKNDVVKAVKPGKNLSLMEWSDFEQQVLGQTLDPDLGYEGMRKKESELMSGEVRISPTENPCQEDKPYVDMKGNPKGNEAVVYAPFFGPWKSGYEDRKSEVPDLFDEMRSVT